MRKTARIMVEMMPGRKEDPDKGYCTQGCPHCPVNAKKGVEVGVYSEDSLRGLDLVQAYLDERRARLMSLDLPAVLDLDTSVLQRLNVDPFPRRLSFSLGNVLSGVDSDDELLELVLGLKTKFRTAVMTIMDQSYSEIEESDNRISVSVVNDLQGLDIVDPRKFVFLVRALFLEFQTLLKSGYPFKTFIFSSCHNAVNPADFDDFLKQDNHIFTKLMAVNYIFDAVIGDGEEVIRELNHTLKNRDEQVLEFTRELYFKYWKADFVTRFIRASQKHDRQGFLGELDELVLTMLPDHVWFQHGTDNTRDKSLRCNYEDFFAIVNEAMSSGDELKDLVFEHIRARRCK
ncbi:hypothetical protein JKY72_06375 [Candidatus Gracilibacteria bacterium]|nr:hypothetical protein [Candidatus Gracilibacteria bacterium]